jgi:hypothetical protein
MLSPAKRGEPTASDMTPDAIVVDQPRLFSVPKGN